MRGFAIIFPLRDDPLIQMDGYRWGGF